jgi:lipopolysaccharide export system protein LptA
MIAMKERQKRVSVCVAFLVLGVLEASGQSSVIEVKTANSLVGDVIGNEKIQKLIGNVHFIQTSPAGEIIKVWCDSARRYMTQNKVELFGHVQLARDTTVLRAPEGVYFGNERRAEMKKGVTLRRGTLTLASRSGQYFSEQKRAFFLGDVVAADSTSTTWCDRLTYFETDERSIAVGNVRVTSSQNSVTVFGDSLVHEERTKYTRVLKNPRLVQIDTTSDGTIDTLVVVSNFMEGYQDSTNRFVATDSVRMVRSDLAARCGRAVLFTTQDRVFLERQPIIWYGQNQVTGDSMTVTLKDRKLQNVLVRGRAMAVSKSDSTNARRFDQLIGRELTMYFNKQKVERIEARRNSISLSYLFDDKTPNGANKTSGDRIRIDFEGGKLNTITVVGGVEGQFFPEAMLNHREQNYNLDGVRWIEQRPRRKQLEIVRE